MHVNFCLDFFFFFFSFTTTKCIIVISFSRMCISRRLLPRVMEVLWYLAETQVCNPLEMFCILHWDTLERSGCILRTINLVLSQTSIQTNYRKRKQWANCFGTVLFFQKLWMNSILVRKFFWHIYLTNNWMWNYYLFTISQMVLCLKKVL